MRYLNKYKNFEVNESSQPLLLSQIKIGDVIEVEGKKVKVSEILTTIKDNCISFEGECDGDVIRVIYDDAGDGYRFY